LARAPLAPEQQQVELDGLEGLGTNHLVLGKSGDEDPARAGAAEARPGMAAVMERRNQLSRQHARGQGRAAAGPGGREQIPIDDLRHQRVGDLHEVVVRSAGFRLHRHGESLT
jgi:hypothetical protein